MIKLKTRNPALASKGGINRKSRFDLSNRGSSIAKQSGLKTRIARGPLKLKPTQVHKTQKTYNRKRVKIELRSLIKMKTPA